MEAKMFWNVVDSVLLVALVLAATMYVRMWVKCHVAKAVGKVMFDASRLQVIRSAIANQYVSGAAVFVRRKDGKMFHAPGRLSHCVSVARAF